MKRNTELLLINSIFILCIDNTNYAYNNAFRNKICIDTGYQKVRNFNNFRENNFKTDVFGAV